MTRSFMLITAVWGLWAMPVLCASGMLDECCEHRCADEEHDECECSECVGLCNARVTKPNADPSTSEVESVFQATLSSGTHSIELVTTPNYYARAWLHPPRITLPFPPSDRPLLL